MITQSLEIPGLIKSVLTFADTYIEYKKTKILYQDITSISFHSKSEWLNGLPLGDDYIYRVKSTSQKISIEFRAKALNIGNQKKTKLYGEILNLSLSHLFPIIIKRYMKQLFVDNEPISIAGILIGKNNIAKLRLIGKPKIIPLIHIVNIVYEDGYVNIYTHRENRRGVKQFTSINMIEDNAVILPYLVPKIIEER